jgi:hypothetical protein
MPFLKDSCPMMFELLLDAMDRFLNLRDRHSNHRIGAHTCTNQPYPTGRLFGAMLSQALRARLRSHRPSGTFCTGSSYS